MNIGNEQIEVETQPDGTYLLTLPTGSDRTNVKLDIKLPPGATIEPDPAEGVDFSNGPVDFTITAEDGTAQVITIRVLVETPAPTERVFFTVLETECEIRYTTNADGTVSVSVLIPFAASSDPSLLATIRATIAGIGYTDVSYAIVDEQGSETPLKSGVLMKLDYTLVNNDTSYVQTLPDGGLEFAEVPKVDETPVSNSSGSSGCDAGVALLIAPLAGMMWRKVTWRRK